MLRSQTEGTEKTMPIPPSPIERRSKLVTVFFVYFGLRSAVWKCNLRHVSCQPHAGFAKSWVQKLIWIQDLNNTLKHVEIQCQLAPDFQQLKLLPREVAYKHLPDVERLHSRKAWPNVQIAHLMLLFDVLQKSELLTDSSVQKAPLDLRICIPLQSSRKTLQL